VNRIKVLAGVDLVQMAVPSATTSAAIDIRVLSRAADDRPIRRESPLAMLPHPVLIDQRADVGFCQLLDLLHFVRGAEAVEDVHERDPRLQGARLGNQGEVHHLLHGIGEQHSPTGGPGGHDILSCPPKSPDVPMKR
jgi:hypothetical protein